MSTLPSAIDFLVNRANLADCRFVPASATADVELAAGEVLLAVDRFALTANNVTYAVAGDMLNYWSFFPAEAGWGRIPVWGFGNVVKSRHDAVSTGERLYGYYPMSSWLRIARSPMACTATCNPALSAPDTHRSMSSGLFTRDSPASNQTRDRFRLFHLPRPESSPGLLRSPGPAIIVRGADRALE